MSETATGDVCVAACFLDAAKSRLRVRVLEARDVRAGDKTGTSDAYVRATLLDGSKGSSQQVFHTKVVWHHLSRLAARVFLPRREKHGEGRARRGPGRIHRRDLWLFRARRRSVRGDAPRGSVT